MFLIVTCFEHTCAVQQTQPRRSQARATDANILWSQLRGSQCIAAGVEHRAEQAATEPATEPATAPATEPATEPAAKIKKKRK